MSKSGGTIGNVTDTNVLVEMAMGYARSRALCAASGPLIDHRIRPARDSQSARRQLESRLMSDLNMLVVTGGKERTEQEWRTMLKSSGFECQAIVPVPSPVRPG